MAKRIPMIAKAGPTRDPKRTFSKGGKKTAKKYACGGKLKK